MKFLSAGAKGIFVMGFLWFAISGLRAAPAGAIPNAAPRSTNSTPAASAATATTNAEPRFTVEHYDLQGNTLLPAKTLNAILTRHTGTNISFDEVTAALKDLQMEYHNRGYDTVRVTIPQQRLTNNVFKLRVFEGRLVEVLVKGNKHSSSNSIMRSLPSLKTNIYLNSKIFQAELDRANADQDRQIYPEIHPGPEPNTSALWLVIEDRLPLHGKIEANNQSSPGTPEQRLNGSIAYNDLWRLNHSLGVQYSCSEEDFKSGDQWNIYDKPLVANYSGFYRLPLGQPNALADEAAANPNGFGYNEATRKFQLPAATGAPELNLYASRSTIDSGVSTGNFKHLSSSSSLSIDEDTVHQDLTVNEGVGLRFSDPLKEFWGIESHAQAGLDVKWYRLASFETNNFIFTEFLHDLSGNPYTNVFVTPSKVPSAAKSIAYLPLALRWDGHRPDKYGSTDFGFGYNPNVWHSGNRQNVEAIAGSSQATGYWHILTASVAREQTIYHDWKIALRADGQWASEPLISVEQFGVGGIAGVRGYREGEVFGDEGWRLTSELKTPTHRIGYAAGGTSWPLTVRGSFFLDYAQADLINPQGRRAVTPLWGTGAAGVAQMGSTFTARLGITLPLLSTPTSQAGHLRMIFAMSAQF
jgi:hemolysin activation/secretion protein